MRIHEPFRPWSGDLRNLPQFRPGLYTDTRPRAKTLIHPNEKCASFPYLGCHCSGRSNGPNRQVKQGAIRLASDLNYMLVPASVYTKSKKIVERRWDKMEIPKPFTSIGLSMGKPMEVPADISKTQIRNLMVELFETLENLEVRASDLIETHP